MSYGADRHAVVSPQCAFKSQCFDRVVSGEPTEEEEKILKARAESRRKMLDCQLKRCTNGTEGSHQCPYMACKSCCKGQKKLCLTHNEREWSQSELCHGFIIVVRVKLIIGLLYQMSYLRWMRELRGLAVFQQKSGALKIRL